MTRQLIRSVVAVALALAGRPDSAWAQVRVQGTLLLPAELRAEPQSIPAYPVVAGSRIRIEAPTLLAGRFEGTVKEIDEQSLLIELANRPAIRVQRQAITQLDVSVGRRRQFLKGAMIGAGICAVMCGLNAKRVEEEFGVNKSQYMAAGLTGGAIWGAAIGALIKTERWAAVAIAPVSTSSTETQSRTVITLAGVRF